MILNLGFPNEDYVNIYKQTFLLRRIAFFGTGATFNYDHVNKMKDVIVSTLNSILLSGRYEYDQVGNRTKMKYEKVPAEN
ncbi:MULTISPECIES: hypothetical protein [Bacillus cereus group]|nr:MULTISPECIES: hypothetical protein [Bacillus cereus group]MED2124473.1 hypothetical protein [Bacillus thuringiensis]MED2151354.1 hypothetical protein [Bacillus thuringiensis]MED2210169.1 hypothetical protein [Bacillus thuringiensis]MED2666556.1 hypothetical protein [Bacillus thuringiensis]MED2695580.1 hypothetical protein [Bacillus thuringiensis]